MNIFNAATFFFIGVVHALEPGHGKIFMMTYLIGSDRKYSNALLLASIATFSHTFVILLLSVGIGISTQYLLPGFIDSGIEILAGGFVLAVGIWMMYSAFNKNHKTHNSHLKTDKGKKSLKELIMLGISGGIVPCPAATAVLSASIASGDVLKGIFFVIIFSLGLGTALLLTGFLFIRTYRFFEVFFTNTGIEKHIDKVSAFLISLLGTGLILKELI